MDFSRVFLGIAVLLAVTVSAVPSAMARDQGGGGSTAGLRAQIEGGTQETASRGILELEPAILEAPRPLFLRGMVIINDGMPTPPNIVIERVCGGRPIPVGYADSEGRFSFELGRSSTLTVGGSTSLPHSGSADSPDSFAYGDLERTFSGNGDVDLPGCSLRASCPGYVSSLVKLSGHNVLDNADVGTIILRKLRKRNGYTTSTNSSQAPEKARRAYRRGVQHARKQRWDKAEHELTKAIEFYPEHAEAWFHLGQVNEAQRQPDDARAAYRRAVTVDIKFYRPYIQLATMDARQGRWQDVARTTAKVLRANHYEFPEAYLLNAISHLNLGNNAKAERMARLAIGMNLAKKCPQLEHILGLALANQDYFDEASAHLWKYLTIVPGASNGMIVLDQLDRVESFRDRQPVGATLESAAPIGQAVAQR